MRNALRTIKCTLFVPMPWVLTNLDTHGTISRSRYRPFPSSLKCSRAPSHPSSLPFQGSNTGLPLQQFAFSEKILEMEPQSTQSFVSDFSHLTQCFWNSSCCCVPWYLVPFYYWVALLCMELPPFLYLFTCWWTFGLFPIWGYYEQLLLRTFACNTDFHFYWVNT